MTTKREWRERAKAAEAKLADAQRALTFMPPLAFDTLTICFSDRTVTLRGDLIKVDANCVSFPLMNNKHLLAPAGWYPVFPSEQP